MLRVERVTKDNSGLKEIHRLYDASFPDDERIPWWRVMGMLDENRRMYVYYEGDQPAGMSYVFIHRSIAYLGYLAVEENMRGRGYGTEILKHIQSELNAYKIVIDIEVLDPSAENSEERLKRRNFYLRAGFEPTGVGYYFWHVDYELLSYNGIVTAGEYRDLIIEHWGPFAKKAVFKEMGNV